jgi:hypothetical protein
VRRQCEGGMGEAPHAQGVRFGGGEDRSGSGVQEGASTLKRAHGRYDNITDACPKRVAHLASLDPSRTRHTPCSQVPAAFQSPSCHLEHQLQPQQHRRSMPTKTTGLYPDAIPPRVTAVVVCGHVTCDCGGDRVPLCGPASRRVRRADFGSTVARAHA